jgi:hypothetical protein
MSEHNLIMMNRYCNDLHDDERIVFCKIDLVLNEFERLKSKKNNVVLIIANGDITFNDRLLSYCPDNVKHIFATNTTCYNDKVTPIPIGVEMSMPPKREGHGEINNGIFEKLPFLTGNTTNENNVITNKLYSNFNISTNPHLRSKVREISITQSHINFEFGVSYSEFVQQVKTHMGTISPRGNGIECIRTYEVLYLNSIPIVVGDISEYKAIYEKIYKNLPIVFIDNLEKLKDFSLIEKEINKVKNNSLETINYEYWVNLIQEKTNKII